MLSLWTLSPFFSHLSLSCLLLPYLNPMKLQSLAKRGESGQSQPFWISAVASIALLIGVIVSAILIHRCIKAKRRQRHTMMLDQSSQEGSSSNHIDAIEQHDPAGRMVQADEEQAIQVQGASEKEKMTTTVSPCTNTKSSSQQKYRLSQLLSFCSHNSVSQQPTTVAATREKEKPCLADPQQIQTPSSSPAINRNHHHHHPHEIQSNNTTSDLNKEQQEQPDEAQTTDQQHLDHHHSSPPLPPRSMKKSSLANINASLGRKSVASIQWVGFRGSMDHRPQHDQLFVVNQDDVV